MKNFVLRWFINVITLLVVSRLVAGVAVDGLFVAVVAALVLGLLNAFLRPLIILVTLPINILSLGIFTLFINGFMFYFVSRLVSGFTVAGFWSAFWGALLFSIVNFLLSVLIAPSKKVRVHVHRGGSGGRAARPGAIDIETVPSREEKEERKQLGEKAD